MPGPPPPPPMAPAAPPPPMFSPPKGGPDDRGALLKSIRQGAKLKKTVTVDKSAPLIPGKISSHTNNGSATSGNNFSSTPTPNGMPLGGLFAGGMPKLRSTGKIGASTLNNSTSNESNLHNNKYSNNVSSNSKPVTPIKNFSNIQNELKKQLASPSDNRNRGPPPPAPVRNVSDDSCTPRYQPSLRENTTNGLHLSQTSLNVVNSSSLHANSSTLHRKTKSNANLSTLDSPDNVNSSSGFQLNKPVINHGKPNLAPKPPSVNNGRPAPPKKLVMNGKISRAHSMRSPRSPSPQSPEPNKFGTVRHLSSIVGQSLAQGSQSPRPRAPLNGRPSVPPPSIPPQQQAPLPPKMNAVKPPNHAPPPPPGSIPQPPSHAPPPPPHKTQPMRPPPAIPGATNTDSANHMINSPTNNTFVPPPPPPRHSSMRETSAPQLHTQRSRIHSSDFEEKFKHLFQTIDRFPRPPAYRNVLKLYSNKQAISKQQAPLPPHLQSSNRTWDPTSTC